ncbi:glycosyltransferase [Marivita sp. S0852]|uniref:glycosyltransferase n=1 Tax=Marivita sp. S0852 TaxID=3373893 RepID=UPI003982B5E4
MFDQSRQTGPRPIGIFVHHQGRGHIERASDLANALPEWRPVTLFCARPAAFPALRPGVEVVALPSLFEPTGDEACEMDGVATPDVLHCAPVGWPGIRAATARLAHWFDAADPAVFISDVSAELALFARICSVPHIMVRQHGQRDDPGHQAAYDAAIGMLAPFDQALAQPDWPKRQLNQTFFAGGLGVVADMPSRQTARGSLGIDASEKLAVVVTSGDPSGLSQAPIAVGARTFPGMRWATIGNIARDWHATEPPNLVHQGWVNNPEAWIAAADIVISSTGNTTCHQVLAAGVPWLTIPEWRYFDEQVEKAKALARANAATVRRHAPSSAQAWREALAETLDTHERACAKALYDPDAATKAAEWLESRIARFWGDQADRPFHSRTGELS